MKQKRPSGRWSAERVLVALILSCSTALSIAYALITPAWANVEEPTHFEYVRFIAEHGRLPAEGERDAAANQRIMDSIMWKHHLIGTAGQMRNRRLEAELGLDSEAAWLELREALTLQPGYENIADPTYDNIGTPQLDEPPGYYVSAALSQALVPNRRIEDQLLAARLVSVLWGLLTVWVAYKAGQQLFPRERALRLVAPIAVGLLPSFTVLASAVNNTIAAVFAVTLATYGAAHLMRRGITLWGLGTVALAAALSLVSKPTALVALPMIVLALPLARQRPWPRWVLYGTAALAVAAVFALFTWQYPKSWYPLYTGGAAVRAETPLGARVVQVSAAETPSGLMQPIPLPRAAALRGQPITVGAWMRGAPQAYLPLVRGARDREFVSDLSERSLAPTDETQWTFHTATVSVPVDTQCLSVHLLPAEGEAGVVEYDGLVLAVGALPASAPPVFETPQARSGTWGGVPFENQLANGSAERGLPAVRPSLVGLLPTRLADTGLVVNDRLANFLDLGTNGPTLLTSARWLFTSFISRFAWTNPGLPRGVALGLGVSAVLAGASVAVHLVKLARRGALWAARPVLLLVAAGVMAILFVLIRIDPVSLNYYCDPYQGRFISTGYYLVPYALPLLTVWYLGLHVLVPRRGQRWLLAATLVGLFVLNAGSLLSRQIPDYLWFYGIR